MVAVAPPTPAATVAAACSRLADRLPGSLDGEHRRTTKPSSPLTAAWGDPPVTLRCGVGRPAGLTLTSQVRVVNGIAWLPVDGADAATWTAVDRTAYVELVVPHHYPAAAGFLTGLTDAVRALPQAPSVLH